MRFTLAFLWLLATGALAQTDHTAAAIAEARQLARLGRALEAQARIERATWSAGLEYPAENGIRNLGRIAHYHAEQGDTAAARAVLRTRTGRIIALARLALPVDAAPAALGAALATSHGLSTAGTRLVLEESVRLLKRLPSPPAELGLALAGLGRDAEAWPILSRGVRTGQRAAECRAALAGAALRNNRLDLARKVLAPRAGVQPGEISGTLTTLVDRLEHDGHADQALALTEGWLAQWNGLSTSARLPGLRMEARLAGKVGQPDVALAAYFAIATVPGELRQDPEGVQKMIQLVNGAATRGAAERKAIFERCRALPTGTLSETPGLLQAFTAVAEAESRLDEAVELWESTDPSTLQAAAPWLTGYAAHLESKQESLAPRMRGLADIAVAPGTYLVAHDRAHPPDATKGEVILRFGPDRVLVDLRTGQIAGAPTAVPELDRFAAILGRVFRDYPPDFPARIDILRFTLNRQPLDAKHSVAAWCAYQVPAIDIHLDQSISDQQWYEILHHELGHMIDYRITGFLDDADWVGLNKKGFAYLDSHDKTLPFDIPDGLVSTYGATDRLEDKADFWQELLLRPEALAARAATDPNVEAKAEFWRRRARAWLPSMDASWFAAKRAHP